MTEDFHRSARELKIPSGRLVRSPGFPLYVWLVSGFDFGGLGPSDFPVRNWNATSPDARLLVWRVILSYHFLGLIIPVLIYLIIYLLSESSLAGIVGALAYYLDLPTVSYQFVILAETLSVFLTLLSILLLILFIRHPRPLAALPLGIVLGFLLLVKTSFIILFGLVILGIVIHSVRRRILRANLTSLGLIIGLPVLLLGIWAFINYHTFNHLFITKNHVVTLNNFSGRHFIQLDPETDDLEVLGKHFRLALEKGKRWSMLRAQKGVQQELGLSEYEYFQLVDRSNMMAIRAFPGSFFRGGYARYKGCWSREFLNIKNSHPFERMSILTNRIEPFPRKLLFGSHSLLASVVAWVVLMVIRSKWMPRLIVSILFVFCHSFIFLTSLVDEAEYIRHGIAARAIINVMFLWAIFEVISLVWRQFRTVILPRIQSRSSTG